jgi:hypothetical protein
MANTFWIKLYLEILDDPKLGRLPDRLWRRFIECCLMAGKFGKGGQLPESSQIAWLLRISTDECELDLKQLAMTGMIQHNQEGWQVTNFSKRQAAIPDAVRKQQQRDNEKKDIYYGHEDDTDLSRNVTQINRLRLTESDSDKTSSSSYLLPPQSEEPAGAKQEEEVLPEEFQLALKDLGVFEPLWGKVAQSPWTKDQIWQLIQDIKRDRQEGKLNGSKPGGIFMYRLNQTAPPMTQAEREELDRRKYVTGPYASLFANNSEEDDE